MPSTIESSRLDTDMPSGSGLAGLPGEDGHHHRWQGDKGRPLPKQEAGRKVESCRAVEMKDNR